MLRFLWVKDPAAEQPEIIELQFARVIFGVSSSPFLLNATIRHHLEHANADPETVNKLLRDFYVDDIVTGANNEDEAHELYHTAKTVLKKGGFNLRKFTSNSLILRSAINREENPHLQPATVPTSPSDVDDTYASITLGSSEKCNPGERSVLGVQWNTYSDELVMSVQNIACAIKIKPTKRAIVNIVGKFYDPLGILSPVVVAFKVFLQELCKALLGWDDVLTGDLLLKWQRLSSSLTKCRQTIQLPRCYARSLRDHSNYHELCGFCDAHFEHIQLSCT